MIYLLDTNICIYIMRQKPRQVLERFRDLEPSDVGISSIAVAELEYGAYKSQQPERNRSALKQFLIPLEIVSFDGQATQVYGKLRSQLEQQGQVIGSLDMLIAAQALSLELTLVTNNTREFSRIAGLALENWAD
ncbi:MAG: type II toxin-antitoxin system VapC family toxin [Cyanobacteria bacterium P01_D01_bin.105]